MNMDPKSTDLPLGITLATIPGALYSVNNLPLRLTFENVSGEEVRILNYFGPLPVFFAFKMVAEDGRRVAIPGAGKIDIPKGWMTYVTLPAGAAFDIELDLAGILAYPEEVNAGTYALSVTYHNQYGQNCFQGIVSSDPISLTVN